MVYEIFYLLYQYTTPSQNGKVKHYIKAMVASNITKFKAERHQSDTPIDFFVLFCFVFNPFMHNLEMANPTFKIMSCEHSKILKICLRDFSQHINVQKGLMENCVSFSTKLTN